MSVLNQSGEELVECPLCMEPLEVDDLHFYPCTCGYQICRFCWNRIREGENGLCPACRKAYPENPADFTPLSQEQVAAIKTEKKAREQKRRNKTLESRRALANVRVVQNNLVFVVGLPVRLADPEILKRQEYFGKYGKIHKVVINQSTSYAGSQVRNLTLFHDKSGPSASAYVTYVSPADALRAIQGVNNVTLDGRVLKGSLGTTKYCANFMKNQPCPKPDCMYLHELGDPRASFTKEEMHAGLHQVYERKLHNQLLQSQKDKPDDKQTNGSGNSSTNAEKSSSKDGNQSNFIPTTVVTSSHINIDNSSKSNNKKEQNGNSNGNSNGSSSSSSGNGNGKEAWPSLSSSPPSDSPARKQPSPQSSTVKSQENGMSSTSESSSPTLPTQAQIKTKDTQQTDKNRTKESTTQSKKNKKQKTNSISNEEDKQTDEYKTREEKINNSVFESQSYLTNELDELESDRHSLLENHDLLDNTDHILLEDETHNLLNDTNDIILHRHREMLAGLDNNINNHLLPKGPMLNGYGLLDREVGYLDRQISQVSQGIMDQKEMLMRHNVMVEPKHFIPSSSIGLDSASELLGANYHQNPNMLPPFGMRVDNSMGNSITPSMSNMSSNMAANALANTGYLLHNQQMLQNQHQMQAGMVNGYDTTQSQTNEGRYLAENMDKFFTDFHKAQQMRLQLNRGTSDRYPHYPHNMLSAERLEMEHKQRLSNMRGADNAGGSGRNATGAGPGRSAAGDGDDDLDFDPFKETQKAFAELMETEMMHNQISSGDNLRRRVTNAPPGFSHLNTQQAAFGMNAPAQQPAPASSQRGHNHQGFVNNSSSVPVSATTAMFSDWSQMDPAIMSVNFTKQQQQLQQASGAAAPSPAPSSASVPSLTHQQQELFARFNQLGLNKQPQAGWGGAHVGGSMGRQLPWSAPHAQYAGIPLPPGFAPPKPQTQHKPECIDAK